MRYSIIIPAKDEEKRIVKTLDAYVDFFRDKDTEIIIVVNNSKDQTLEIALKYKESGIVRVIEVNKTDSPFIKGLAVKVGFENALAEYVGFIDGDMSTSPEEAYRLLLRLEKIEADGLIANRYHNASVMEPAPTVLRKFFSRGFNLLSILMFNLNYRDTQCGAKFFKNPVAKEIAMNLVSYGWIFDVDMLYYCKNAGYNVEDEPTVWVDKAGSKLKILTTIRRISIEILKLKALHLKKYYFKKAVSQDTKYISNFY